MTSWQTFTAIKRRTRGADNPDVTITRSRIFYLNSAAIQLLSGADRVALLWDAERRCIGIQPASESDPHGFRLTHHTQGGSGRIAGRSFLDYYGLLDIVGQSVPAHLEGDVLVVPLAPATDGETAVRS